MRTTPILTQSPESAGQTLSRQAARDRSARPPPLTPCRRQPGSPAGIPRESVRSADVVTGPEVVVEVRKPRGESTNRASCSPSSEQPDRPDRTATPNRSAHTAHHKIMTRTIDGFPMRILLTERPHHTRRGDAGAPPRGPTSARRNPRATTDTTSSAAHQKGVPQRG